eukprot:scaffold51041_cov36-Tisochrysis_lutea.AAC.4
MVSSDGEQQIHDEARAMEGKANEITGSESCSKKKATGGIHLFRRYIRQERSSPHAIQLGVHKLNDDAMLAYLPVFPVRAGTLL